MHYEIVLGESQARVGLRTYSCYIQLLFFIRHCFLHFTAMDNMFPTYFNCVSEVFAEF